MTEKLYYEDPFMMEFTAKVLRCEKEKNGWSVVLDRTAFYPEGGGQPADQGFLGSASVITDTRERDGVICHTCTQPLEVGSTVTGVIDFIRRFDFMQQHSGEHIVSGIICSRHHCDNVGFHIGHDLVTIDFNTDLTPEELLEIEYHANKYIWENHILEVSYPSPEELDALQYRSKKVLTGSVRIVTWPGADCCACCGTHVRSSGQVGMVKLISCQKFKEGVRIEMAAGGRVLQWSNRIAQQNTQVSQMLSAKPTETAAAVARLQKELYTLKGRITALEEQDFARKAEQYSGKGDVLLLEGPMSAESIRKLCTAVQAAAGGLCAVFSGENDLYQYAVSDPANDLRSAAKELNAALNGRGGGKPAFIQGSVQAGAEDICGFFERYFSNNS